METKIFKNYNEFGSRTNKSTNGVTEDFLKDINVSWLCVVALSKNLKLTSTHSWAITQNPCYVPFLFGL